MTKRNVCAGLALCLVAQAAVAKQLGTTEALTREWNFDGCHFTMRDPYKGRIDIGSYIATLNPKANHPFETWIQFSCEPATSKTYFDLTSTRLTSQGWVLDTSKEDPRPPSLNTTLYVLHGKGWEGAGTTQDETDGDEARRERNFNFCIPHRQLALCGSIQNVAYLMWPKESTLPQVIKLLESIEFIDTPPIKQAVPANPSTAP